MCQLWLTVGYSGPVIRMARLLRTRLHPAHPRISSSVHTSMFLQVEPFLPYEYTCEGMLERVHAYIQNQVGLKTRPGGRLMPVAASIITVHMLPLGRWLRLIFAAVRRTQKYMWNVRWNHEINCLVTRCGLLLLLLLQHSVTPPK